MDRSYLAADRVYRADFFAHIDADALCRIDLCFRPHGDIIFDRAGRAFFYAQAACDALGMVDPGMVILDLDRVNRAGPDADAAGDAANLALFLRIRALVPAVTADHDRFRCLGQLDHLLGTGGNAFAAGSAFVRIDDRKIIGAHRDGIKRTGPHAGAVVRGSRTRRICRRPRPRTAAVQSFTPV